MKSILIIIIAIFITSSTSIAQFRQSGITKYDYQTYKGTPIQKGWLFSDSTYRKLYKSYAAADTMVTYFEKQGIRLENLANSFESVKKEYSEKAYADLDLILEQQKTIGTLTTSFNSSQTDNAKIMKQFWDLGSIKLHKGTTISVGFTALLLGYMVGKTF